MEAHQLSTLLLAERWGPFYILASQFERSFNVKEERLKQYDPSVTPINRQRRAKNVMDDKWIVQFLTEVQIGHIATRWGEQPFINPSTFWYSPEKHEIYFHSNAIGRVRANSQMHPEVCFESYRSGRLLPSNIPLEKSMQYEAVVAFGTIRVVEDHAEKRDYLQGLLDKYFGEMESGKDYRPITEDELKQTSVYAIAVDNWSGKRNWKDRADQGEADEWPPLDEKWFDHY